MGAEPFEFKQFTVAQKGAAMKVGTDGVLLGAWTPLPDEAQQILDIGSGTGLIALMLAQRSDAPTIDGLEIDPGAYELCVENFESSPWADRLFCYHGGLEEFAGEVPEAYDTIVSNPPFHRETVSSGDLARDTARQLNSLPFDVLLEGVGKLLRPGGIFSLIVPFRLEAKFCTLARNYRLFPFRITRVRGHEKAPLKRSLLAFSDRKVAAVEDTLTIEEDRHVYTEPYKKLTRDFYLKM
jgi:tRNA1Val (adenine37-N6)-methyltransferase